MKSTSAIASFLSLGLAAGGAGSLGMLGGYAMMMSTLSYSRQNEQEADAYGLKLIGQHGYDPMQAARVWKILLEEREATAEARKRKVRDPSNSIFSTHPPSQQRFVDLSKAGEDLMREQGSAGQAHTDRYRAALGTHRLDFLEDQIKLNDFGGSLYLIDALGQDGWDSELHYAKGELYRMRGNGDDFDKAVTAYQAAVTDDGAPPEAYRGLGYAMMKTGQADAGKAWLRRYLAAKPDANDAPLIQMMAQ